MCLFLKFERLILISSQWRIWILCVKSSEDRYYLELKTEDHVLEN